LAGVEQGKSYHGAAGSKTSDPLQNQAERYPFWGNNSEGI